MHVRILTDAGTVPFALASHCTLSRHEGDLDGTVVAFDREAHRACTEANVSVDLWDSQNVADKHAETEPLGVPQPVAVFTRRGRRLQWLKFAMLAEWSQQLGRLLVLTDADVVWLNAPAAAKHLQRVCLDTDVAFMDNTRERSKGYMARANAGFIVSCGTERARNFWRWTALHGLRLQYGTDGQLQPPSDGTLQHRVWRAVDSLEHTLLLRRQQRLTMTPMNDQHLLNFELLLSRELTWKFLDENLFKSPCKGAEAHHLDAQVLVFHTFCTDTWEKKRARLARALRRVGAHNQTRCAARLPRFAIEDEGDHLGYARPPPNCLDESCLAWTRSQCDKKIESDLFQPVIAPSIDACMQHWSKHREVVAIMFNNSTIGKWLGMCRAYTHVKCSQGRLPEGWLAMDRANYSRYLTRTNGRQATLRRSSSSPNLRPTRKRERRP